MKKVIFLNIFTVLVMATGSAANAQAINEPTSDDNTFSLNSTNSSTAINQLADNTTNSLVIYPNPVTSAARIMLPEASYGKVYVDVMDMNGRVNRSYEFPSGSYQLDLDMSALHTGLYSVRVSGKGMSSRNLRVVKQ